MAIYYWKFSVTCTAFNILCVVLLSHASTLQEERPYYEYIAHDELLVSPANVDFKLMDASGKQTLRSRRQADYGVPDLSPGSPSLKVKLTDNSSPINSAKKATGSGATNGNIQPPVAVPQPADTHSGVPLANVPSGVNLSAGDVVPSGNKLQQARPSSNTSKVPDVPTSAAPVSTSTSSPNNVDNGQIVSAEFESHVTKTTTDLASKLSDLLKEKDADIDISQFPDDIITNSSILKQDSTIKNLDDIKVIKDTHTYYNSTFIVDEKIGHQYWVDMSDKSNVKIHGMLSQSHRRAATVKLSFSFPFYGHLVTNVTIATGGFLFTGDHIHTWLAATQYIAPLMANFDTRLSEYSFVKYLDNGTAFTVLWENVQLKDTPEYGNFTFEATLHQSGDIVFVYKHIPVVVEQIKDDHHPVKVGLSDAYIIDRTIFFVKRKTIYEYHRVNIGKEDIRNWTVIYLNALPTCRDMKDCESCVHSTTSFECKWCPSVGRCSTGLDRARQEWQANECENAHVSQCNEFPPPPHAHKAAEPTIIISKQNGVHTENSRAMLGTSGVISMLLLVTSVVASGLLLLYAYRNPHSTPGQLLIRYRPSQWGWRRGEARYTAATIHM